MTHPPTPPPSSPSNADGHPGDDYLWDGSGAPDPLIADLERALAPLKAKPIPAPVAMVPPAPRRRGLLALAAMLALAALASWIAFRPTPAAPAGDWLVAYGKSPPAPAPADRRIAAGDAPARLEHAAAGVTLDLRPGAVVTLNPAKDRTPVVTLEHGALDARAGPEQELLVHSRQGDVLLAPGSSGALALEPAASLTVDHGEGRVLAGASDARVAAGMSCDFTRDDPGVPIRLAAADDFRYAARMMRDHKTETKALYALNATAKPEDAATLWNVARRLSGDDRTAVLLKLGELVPPPGGWPKSKTPTFTDEEMDAWWRAIGARR